MENANKNSSSVILEIRQGVGGDEASLFAYDLMQMYNRFSQKNNLRCEIVEFSKNTLGGIKEAIIKISGPNALKSLSHEGGVHRVQRIPKTERYGRIHTSTVSIAVIPYDLKENEEIKIDNRDLRITTFRASGPGGQYVNKTDSAIRIVHIPTNTTVSSQEERSQHKNREKALKILKMKLYLLNKEQKENEIGMLRKDQIQTQDRSFKIRTYNFKQDRLTDHRLKKSFHNLESILQGNLDLLIRKYRD